MLRKKTEYTKREMKALLLYQGCGVPMEIDAFYTQENAYRTFNLLMMEGREGERVRVCVEDQRPKELYLRRWEKTMEVLTDLFTLQCKYAIEQKRAGKPLPNPLERGERGINFRLMKQAGGTFAFTSSSKEKAQDTFLFGKEDPHILHISLGEGVPYLDYEGFLGDAYSFKEEREVLLPPMVPMTCGAGWVEEYSFLGPVHHYGLRLEGFMKPRELVDEKELTDFLNAHAEEAAKGLADLVKRKKDADIFAQKDHIYWQWKDAFRQLTLQRMRAIYEHYYG